MLKSALNCIIKISYGNIDIQASLFNRVSVNLQEAEKFAKSLKNIFSEILEQEDQKEMVRRVFPDAVAEEDPADPDGGHSAVHVQISVDSVRELLPELPGLPAQSRREQQRVDHLLQHRAGNQPVHPAAEVRGPGQQLHPLQQDPHQRDQEPHELLPRYRAKSGPCQQNQIIFCKDKSLIQYINFDVLQTEINFTSSEEVRP